MNRQSLYTPCQEQCRLWGMERQTWESHFVFFIFRLFPMRIKRISLLSIWNMALRNYSALTHSLLKWEIIDDGDKLIFSYFRFFLKSLNGSGMVEVRRKKKEGKFIVVGENLICSKWACALFSSSRATGHNSNELLLKNSFLSSSSLSLAVLTLQFLIWSNWSVEFTWFPHSNLSFFFLFIFSLFRPISSPFYFI